MSEAVEFGSKRRADHWREKLPGEYVCADDDRRTKTLRLSSSTPDSVVERLHAEAEAGQLERETRSHTVHLSDSERDRISDLGGFDGIASTYSWESAKGVFSREGLLSYWSDALGAVADYEDPIEGAEAWVQRYKDRGGSGSARNRGEEDITRRQRARESAETVEAQSCDHAREGCEEGHEDACEFLEAVCDVDDAESLLVDHRDTTDDSTDQVTLGEGDDSITVAPEAAGALQQAWRGYKSAVSTVADALDDIRDELRHARRAVNAINAVRESAGEDALTPRRLDELTETLAAMPDSVGGPTSLREFGPEPEARLREREPRRSPRRQEEHLRQQAPRPRRSERRLSEIAPDPVERETVDHVLDVDDRDQRTLDGGEADDGPQQARISVDDRGERTERRHQSEQSSGGLMRDTRDDPSRGASRERDSDQRDLAATAGLRRGGQGSLDNIDE